MYGEPYLPLCRGDFFGQRVLGQGSIAFDYRSCRRQGSARLAIHKNLFHFQHAAWRWERSFEGSLSAASESFGSTGRPTSAIYRIGQMGHGRDTATRQPSPKTGGWDVREARSELHRIP